MFIKQVNADVAGAKDTFRPPTLCDILKLGLCGISGRREVRLGPFYAFIREFLLDPVRLVLKFVISTLDDEHNKTSAAQHALGTNLIESYPLVVSGELLNKLFGSFHRANLYNHVNKCAGSKGRRTGSTMSSVPCTTKTCDGCISIAELKANGINILGAQKANSCSPW